MQDSLFLSFIHYITREKDLSEISSSYPKLISLLENSEDNFLLAVKDSILFFQKEHFSSPSCTDLLNAFAHYIEKEILPIIDALPISFFITTNEEKEKILDSLCPKGYLSKNILHTFLLSASYEETQDILKNIILKIHPEKENIIVQSAREISPEIKGQIRKTFGEKAAVTFQVHRSLLGGMLIYKNGEIMDSSWIGKITALKKLTV